MSEENQEVLKMCGSCSRCKEIRDLPKYADDVKFLRHDLVIYIRTCSVGSRPEWEKAVPHDSCVRPTEFSPKDKSQK